MAESEKQRKARLRKAGASRAKNRREEIDKDPWMQDISGTAPHPLFTPSLKNINKKKGKDKDKDK